MGLSTRPAMLPRARALCTVACPSKAFMQDLEATLCGSQRQVRASIMEVPSWSLEAKWAKPHRGAVLPAPPQRGGTWMCMHVESLELPDYILFYAPWPDVSWPLIKPQTVCYAKGKEGARGCLQEFIAQLYNASALSEGLICTLQGSTRKVLNWDQNFPFILSQQAMITTLFFFYTSTVQVLQMLIE